MTTVIPLRIWQIILEHLKSISQIRLRQVCKRFLQLRVTNFYVSYPYLHKVTDEIIFKYPYIESLNLFRASTITNINHFKFLTLLSCGGSDSGISDSSIKDCIHLTKLYTSYNPKITNVNYLQYLIELDASGNCGISDNGIKDCINLKVLYANYNSKITTVNHFNQLRILGIAGGCGISDSGILNCVNLQHLYVSNNFKISNINHCKLLERLVMNGDCGITNNGFKECVNIRNLGIVDNTRITDIRHLIKLEVIDTNQKDLKRQFNQIKYKT